MEYDTVRGEYDLFGNPKESFQYCIGAAIYWNSVFRKVGLFDPTLNLGEDIDWYNRAPIKGKCQTAGGEYFVRQKARK